MATVDAVARVATTGRGRATLVLGDGTRVVRVEDVVRVEVRRRRRRHRHHRDEDDDDDARTLAVTAIARRRGFPGISTRKRSARRLKTH